ncbi:hypothetical protein N177_1964 [Lutibaculum baratangense AMV1]|uniref:Uncharacterized protein n=1 Tax=Lutibaculum baratangense AMV1 TaxID=631454 RepID=V4RPG8_9HYPH|nr:hypothetical protein N177_1964 [Lutibaculum baratangense AMV1]
MRACAATPIYDESGANATPARPGIDAARAVSNVSKFLRVAPDGVKKARPE